MLLAGRIFKTGKHWAIEVPILGITTQGHTKKEAFEMITDAVESLANRKGFKINVYPSDSETFTLGSNNQSVLAAFVLRRVREKNGLSLAEAAERLGVSSRNAYARYEQGKSMPTLTKFSELLRAISGRDFVLSEAR